jgi:hypothetical protein
MKHSPGPWTDRSTEFTAGWRCVVELSNGKTVDIADPRDREVTEQDRANASLIAAAPELLEALLSRHPYRDGNCGRESCLACAAILKALRIF